MVSESILIQYVFLSTFTIKKMSGLNVSIKGILTLIIIFLFFLCLYDKGMAWSIKKV